MVLRAAGPRPLLSGSSSHEWAETSAVWDILADAAATWIDLMQTCDVGGHWKLIQSFLIAHLGTLQAKTKQHMTSSALVSIACLGRGANLQVVTI